MFTIESVIVVSHDSVKNNNPTWELAVRYDETKLSLGNKDLTLQNSTVRQELEIKLLWHCFLESFLISLHNPLSYLSHC